MATKRIPILGWATKPDASGSVFAEPSAIKLTNDLYNNMVWVFNDAGTKLSLSTRFMVPKDYVQTPKIVIAWATSVTSGTVQWDIDYRAIADTESFDPTTHQESVNSGTVTVAGTTFLEKVTSISLTSANLAADDVVDMLISRDTSADNAAAAALLIWAAFEYADA